MKKLYKELSTQCQILNLLYKKEGDFSIFCQPRGKIELKNTGSTVRFLTFNIKDIVETME